MMYRASVSFFSPPRHHQSNNDKKTHPTDEKEETNAPTKSGKTMFSIKAPTVKFLPNLSHDLTDWLSFPNKPQDNVILNSITLPFKWLLWTSKGLAGLPPNQNMRERLCNQSTSLGSVAGLYLVIAISAFLVPPGTTTHKSKPCFFLNSDF